MSRFELKKRLWVRLKTLTSPHKPRIDGRSGVTNLQTEITRVINRMTSRGEIYAQVRDLSISLRKMNVRNWQYRGEYPRGSKSSWMAELIRLQKIEAGIKRIMKRAPKLPKHLIPKRKPKPRIEAPRRKPVVQLQAAKIARRKIKKREKRIARENRMRREREERQQVAIEDVTDATVVYDFTGEPYRKIGSQFIQDLECPDYADNLLMKWIIRDSGITHNVRALFYVNENLIREKIYSVIRGDMYKTDIWSDWTINGVEYDEESEPLWSDYIEEEGDLEDSLEVMKIVVQPAVDLTARQIAQSFLDSIDHCVFTPPLLWAEKELNLAQISANKKAKNGQGTIPKRIRQRYNRIIKICKFNIIEMYNGATIEQIQEFCNNIGVNYIIDDIFTLSNKGVRFLTIKSKKESRKTFKFINTRINHLELSNIAIKRQKNNCSLLSSEQMNNKYFELIENDVTPIYCKNSKDEFTWISTVDEYYQKENKTNEVYDKFYDYLEKTHKINRNQLNISFDNKISKLVRAGCHQCAQFNFPAFNELDFSYFNGDSDKDFISNDGPIYKRVDQKKAYANFKKCSYYQGFVHAFTEYRNVCTDNNRKFLFDHVGIFYVDNIDISGMEDNSRKIVEEMKIYSSINALPSFELVFMIDSGITFNIKYGTWGQVKFDFDFPDFMFERENKDSPRWYQKIVGSWGMASEQNTIYIDGDKKWAEHIKSMGYKVQYYDPIKILHKIDNKSEPKEIVTPASIRVIFDKKDSQIKHKNQMAGFICSYHRITLMQQLFKIKIDDIFSVICDEIVVRTNAKFELDELFREKNSNKAISSYSANNFLSRYNHKIIPPSEKALDLIFSEGKYYRGEFLYPKEGATRILNVGQGGSGKSYTNIFDDGWVDLLYTAPSHKLRASKQEESNIKTEVQYNVLNYPRLSEYRYGNEIRNVFSPSVIIWDESTQATNSDDKKLKEYYPHALIIYCGDHDEEGWSYQLANMTGEILTTDDFCIVTHTGNRRAKDNTLKEFLEWYRKNMKACRESAKTGSVLCSRWSRQSVIALKKNLLEKLKDRLIYRDEVEKLYSLDDYILVGTKISRKNKTSGIDYWTKILGHIGFKYLVTKLINNKSMQYYNGTVLIPKEKISHKYIESRHAFTCHQIQGETIESKIFIDLDNLFDVFRMFYVAISRAEYMKNIYIIVDKNPIVSKDCDPDDTSGF